MQANASRPLTGPASTSTLAACGGLDAPGRELHPYAVGHETLSHEPIPGERDRETLTAREPGAMGTFSGAQLPRADPQARLTEDEIEGFRRDGGDVSRKRKR
jgi:hypothetical protein